MTWTGMVVVLAGTAFLVGSRADGETPTAAPLDAIAEPQPARNAASEGANKGSAPTRSPRPSTGATAGARRFAWAPVAGSTGYHVELFRGSALVFRDETTKPEIVIRNRWRLDGRLRRLEPGSYRWYVWPLVNGRRTASAIVQARLVVPPA
jgi:hypothetical protein